MIRLFLFATILLAAACGEQDYAIEGSNTQTLKADKIKHLIIECYCEKGVEVSETNAKTVQINIEGKLVSIGYQGEQTTPREIEPEMLTLKPEVEDGTLRLKSREWTYIHHSFLIDHLKIQIPRGVRYEVVKIPEEELEGRKI